MRQREIETKDQHLYMFIYCMQRHAEAYRQACNATIASVRHCYQQEQHIWYLKANWHRECWQIAPIEPSGWRLA